MEVVGVPCGLFDGTYGTPEAAVGRTNTACILTSDTLVRDNDFGPTSDALMRDNDLGQHVILLCETSILDDVGFIYYGRSTLFFID